LVSFHAEFGVWWWLELGDDYTMLFF